MDDTLADLARIHPDTKFLRARASSLGFASSRSHAAAVKPAVTRRIPGHFQDDVDGSDDDDDDPYSDDDNDEDRRGQTGANVDLDVLPTLLVYRDGDLVQNWVRVDWEAGRAGIEELLSKSVAPLPHRHVS